jgi:hypothetical protein
VYTVDRDSVLVLDVPQPEVGAPLPILLADDQSAQIAYIVHEVDPNWDGTYANMVGTDSADQPIALVSFVRPYAHIFGPPNDEAFACHPLFRRGLQPYSVAEVSSSSWIRQLERMNAVHPNHQPKAFDSYRHFVFAFHDSTFECVAMGLAVSTMRGSMREAVTRMVAALPEGAP